MNLADIFVLLLIITTVDKVTPIKEGFAEKLKKERLNAMYNYCSNKYTLLS
jgi:hypothetical protein